MKLEYPDKVGLVNTVGTLPYRGTVGRYRTVGTYGTYGRYQTVTELPELLPGKGKDRGKMLARTDKET